MSASQSISRDHHTAIPAKPDLIRLSIGMIGIGTSGPLIAMSGMPILTLIFWRNLGGAIFTLPFALRHARDRAGVKWAVIAGVKLSGGHIPSSAWLGMIVCFIGVGLVSGVDLQISVRAFTGDVAAIISAALAAAYIMAGAKAQRTLETSTYTTICYFVCSMTALPMALIAGYEIVNFSGKEWLILLGLIVGAQLLGHTMFNSVLKRVSPAVVSLIVFFEVPLSALLALWWLGQKPPIGIFPGIVLILIGCVLVVTRTRGASND